jgi:hypothetical protein
MRDTMKELLFRMAVATSIVAAMILLVEFIVKLGMQFLS